MQFYGLHTQIFMHKLCPEHNGDIIKAACQYPGFYGTCAAKAGALASGEEIMGFTIEDMLLVSQDRYKMKMEAMKHQ